MLSNNQVSGISENRIRNIIQSVVDNNDNESIAALYSIHELEAVYSCIKGAQDNMQKAITTLVKEFSKIIQTSYASEQSRRNSSTSIFQAQKNELNLNDLIGSAIGASCITRIFFINKASESFDLCQKISGELTLQRLGNEDRKMQLTVIVDAFKESLKHQAATVDQLNKIIDSKSQQKIEEGKHVHKERMSEIRFEGLNNIIKTCGLLGISLIVLLFSMLLMKNRDNYSNEPYYQPPQFGT